MSAVGDRPTETPAPPIVESGEGHTYLPQVAKGAMINLSGTITRILLGYGYTILVARMLTIEDLGQYFLILTVINILGLACTVGLDFGVVRYVALYAGEGNYRLVRKTLKTALLLSVAIGVAVMLVMAVLAPTVVSRLLGGEESSITALRIFAISIPFWVAAKLLNAATQGLHRMRYQVYSRDIGEQLLKFSLTILVVAAGVSLAGVVWANVAAVIGAMLLSLVFAMMVIRNLRGEPVAEDTGATRSLLTYSFPLAFSNILGMVLVWNDMLVMGYLGTSTEVGYYGAALRVGVVSSAIFLAFTTVFTPVISDLHNRHLVKHLNSLYKTVTRWIFICTLPVVLLQLLFAGPIMKMFGSEFAAGSTALMILSLSQLVNSASGPAGYMVLMSGRSRLELLNISVSLVVNLGVCFLLIPRYGAVGAALANLAATLVINLMRATEVGLFMRVHAYDLNYLKPVLAGAASAAIVVLGAEPVIGETSALRVAILALAMLVSFLAVTIALGLSPKDSEVLDLVKKRLTRVEKGWTS